MMHIWVFLLAFAQVSKSSLLLHNITKREAPAKSKCPACQASSLCSPKYEMFTGHTACMPKSAAAKPVAMTDAERNEIVKYHNQLRATVTPPPANMLQLKWDSEVEMLARRWADACSRDANKRFFHDSLRFIPGRFPVGQNLAWGGYPSFKEATDAWYEEKRDYAPYFGTELNQFPSGPQIGHYTQMVWASTSLIGCAATVCDTSNFYVCNYAPGGNIMPFSSPYKSGTTAGELCKKRTDKGLCDCGDFACENFSDTNATACSCDCRYAVQVAPSCALDCSKPAGSFCGTQNNFMATDCTRSYMPAACPHLCGICPCAESKYTSKMCSTGSSNSRIGHLFTAMSVVLGYAMAF